MNITLIIVLVIMGLLFKGDTRKKSPRIRQYKSNSIRTKLRSN